MVAHLRSSGWTRFLSELRRRHVARVTVGYAAVGFVLLQMAEIVLPAFLPAFQADAALRVVVVAFLLLCPVAVTLAWIYEIAPDGIRATEALDAASGRAATAGVLPRVALLALTILVAGTAGLWWYRTDTAALAEAQARRALRQSAFVTAAPAAAQGRTGPAEQRMRPVIPVGDADFVSRPVTSVAVLPPRNLSAPEEGDLTYFTSGMHDALVTELSGIGGARVVSRTTTEAYRSEGKSLSEVGRELDVESVLEASVVRSGERIRVTVKLVHAPTDAHLWAHAFEYPSWDVIGVQRDVSAAVAADVVAYLGGHLLVTGVHAPGRSSDAVDAVRRAPPGPDAAPAPPVPTSDRAIENR